MSPNTVILLIAAVLVALLIGIAIGLYFGRKSGATGLSERDMQDRYISKDLYERELRSNQELREEYKQLNERLIQVKAEWAGKEQEYLNLQRRLKEHNEEMSRLREEFHQQFKLTATEILEKNSDAFRKRTGDHMTNLLDPLKEKLASFEKKVQETYEKGQSERIELKTEVKKLVEQNESLKTEANNLTRALKGDVKMQGNWGEVILEKLLERSGLKKGVEYFTQEHHAAEDGKRSFLDVVVHLPEEKYIVIDSKVSLVDYERMTSADTPDEQQKALKSHIASIRAHVKGLSEKQYQHIHGDKSPDFVLLFIPIEGAFSAALQTDHNLYQDAYDKNIVVVTTSTLMATLQIISAIWKQEHRSKNIQEIAERGQRLYDKFVLFIKDMGKLGDQLDLTRRTYDSAVNKLSTGRGNLVSQAEQLRKLGISTTKRIDARFKEDEVPEDELNENEDIENPKE